MAVCGTELKKIIIEVLIRKEMQWLYDCETEEMITKHKNYTKVIKPSLKGHSYNNYNNARTTAVKEVFANAVKYTRHFPHFTSSSRVHLLIEGYLHRWDFRCPPPLQKKIETRQLGQLWWPSYWTISSNPSRRKVFSYIGIGWRRWLLFTVAQIFIWVFFFPRWHLYIWYSSLSGNKQKGRALKR